MLYFDKFCGLVSIWKQLLLTEGAGVFYIYGKQILGGGKVYLKP